MATPARALTIAGSDSGGGAGLQADLKVFTALGVYGLSVVTAVTAQNTVAVEGVMEVPPAMVGLQLRAVLSDIGADAVKTGMLASAAIIQEVAHGLRRYGGDRLVVDPVMVAKSGAALLAPDAVRTLVRELLPLALVLTPNLPEAGALLGGALPHTPAEAKAAVKELASFGPRWVVLKGGHRQGKEAVDLVYDGRDFYELAAPWVVTQNGHGTGCTFAAALTAGLAQGLEVVPALQRAKELVSWGLEHALPLGSGHGPTNHFYFQRKDP